MDYSNKVILIAGASSVTGRSTAPALARHDDKLVLTAGRRGELEDLAAQITAPGSIFCTGDGRPIMCSPLSTKR